MQSFLFYSFVLLFPEHKVESRNFQRKWRAFLFNVKHFFYDFLVVHREVAIAGAVLTIARLVKGTAVRMCKMSVFPSLNPSFLQDSLRYVLSRRVCIEQKKARSVCITFCKLCNWTCFGPCTDFSVSPITICDSLVCHILSRSLPCCLKYRELDQACFLGRVSAGAFSRKTLCLFKFQSLPWVCYTFCSSSKLWRIERDWKSKPLSEIFWPGYPDVVVCASMKNGACRCKHIYSVAFISQVNFTKECTTIWLM